jgi:hypothetical protein
MYFGRAIVTRVAFFNCSQIDILPLFLTEAPPKENFYIPFFHDH